MQSISTIISTNAAQTGADPADRTHPLAVALATLFEPSEVLYTHLVPSLSSRLRDPLAPRVTSFADLIDAALAVVFAWDANLQAQFIAGHPRIGETKNLSSLSAAEQAARATPPEVLSRLEYLNACYERRFPGLRYITFVNGRSRAEIATEMEGVLGIGRQDVPNIVIFEGEEVGGVGWNKELERAVTDIGRIAKNRLGTLNLAWHDEGHAKDI